MFINRNVKTSNEKVKETTYSNYVRPQVEYFFTVWHPWRKYLSYKLEQLQGSASRLYLK